MLGNEEQGGVVGCSTGGFDDVPKTLGLALQGGEGSAGLSLHHRLNTISLTFLDSADFFRVRFSESLNLGFLDLCWNDNVGILRGFFTRSSGCFRFLLGSIGFFKRLCTLDLFSGGSKTQGLGFLNLSGGVRLRS